MQASLQRAQSQLAPHCAGKVRQRCSATRYPARASHLAPVLQAHSPDSHLGHTMVAESVGGERSGEGCEAVFCADDATPKPRAYRQLTRRDAAC